MDKPNGSRPAERLAAALQECVEPPGRADRTAKLAEALQGCLDAATSKATRAAERAEKAAERAEAAVERMETSIKPTLHMIWKQCKGDPNQRLPIDD